MNKKMILNYFQYASFIYNDGRGDRDATIADVCDSLFDDELTALVDSIEGRLYRVNDLGRRERITPEVELMNMLPEYYSLEKFY